MEINQPERGIFKGIGKLQTNKHINKKYFPNVRNIHHFQYTHAHRNDYKTSFQSFRPFQMSDYKYQRVKKNANESHFEVGTSKIGEYQSENKNNYRKYNYSLPPKPIKREQEGLGINQYSMRTGEKINFTTTSNEHYNPFKKVAQNKNVHYRYSRTDRFNPITGEFKSNTGFGYEDFVPSINKNYKANNHTVIPSKGQRYDIISGRKLTYF